MLDNDILQSDKIVPYLNPDEQLIQLGPLNICCELFLLSIAATCIENLHLLLPEHLTDKDSVARLSYRVLENDVELKSFKTDGRISSPHEKVIVRIRSSLSVLKHYLQLKPHMSIFLKHENNVIADSLVNLRSLVPTDNLQEFLKCTANASAVLHERCFLTKPDLTEKPAESQCQRPYLDVQLKLQYIGSKTDIVHNSDTIVNSNSRVMQYRAEENVNNAGQVYKY